MIVRQKKRGHSLKVGLSTYVQSVGYGSFAVYVGFTVRDGHNVMLVTCSVVRYSEIISVAVAVVGVVTVSVMVVLTVSVVVVGETVVVTVVEVVVEVSVSV